MKTTLTTEEVNEAIALYLHLINHPEVMGAPLHPGEPMCKICNKTAKEILKDSQHEEVVIEKAKMALTREFLKKLDESKIAEEIVKILKMKEGEEWVLSFTGRKTL